MLFPDVSLWTFRDKDGRAFSLLGERSRDAAADGFGVPGVVENRVKAKAGDNK